MVSISALLLLFPLRLFEVGNPDWRPLGWLHAAITASITLALLWKIGGKPWLMHFAFPVAFIFVAVPWVSPIEAPIVQGLMRVVASIASETLNLCGIPAQLEGSVIRVNTGLVGVNEACSGVRSLQTSLMIGLLFGELKRDCTATDPNPRSFNKCPAVNNNAGLAFDATYTKYYPLMYSFYKSCQAKGWDLKTAVDALKQALAIDSAAAAIQHVQDLIDASESQTSR